MNTKLVTIFKRTANIIMLSGACLFLLTFSILTTYDIIVSAKTFNDLSILIFTLFPLFVLGLLLRFIPWCFKHWKDE